MASSIHEQYPTLNLLIRETRRIQDLHHHIIKTLNLLCEEEPTEDRLDMASNGCREYLVVAEDKAKELIGKNMTFSAALDHLASKSVPYVGKAIAIDYYRDGVRP
jgi:hypothetical protein